MDFVALIAEHEAELVLVTCQAAGFDAALTEKVRAWHACHPDQLGVTPRLGKNCTLRTDEGGGLKPLVEKPSDLGDFEPFCLSSGHGQNLYFSARPDRLVENRKAGRKRQFRLGRTA